MLQSVRILRSFFIILLLSNCSFNSIYYRPNKNPVAINNLDCTDIYLLSKNKKKIHALYYPNDTSIATILILHGTGGNLSSWSTVAKTLNSYGFQSFIFDYQGYGNSEGKATHQNVYDDALAALSFIRDSLIEPDKKIVLLGFSLGGNLAIKIAAENQGKIDALITEGAFTSHEDIALYYTPKLLKPIVKALVKNTIDGKTLIQSIDIPKLIIHSREDEVIPFEMGKELYELASEPKEIWETKGNHLRSLKLYETEYVLKIKNLIK